MKTIQINTNIPSQLTATAVTVATLLTLTACSQPTPARQENKPNQTQKTTQPVASQSASQTSQTASGAASTATSSAVASTTLPASSVATTATPSVSQHFTTDNPIEKRLKEALPEISYSVDNLTPQAQATNIAVFGKAAANSTQSINKTASSTPASAVATTQNQATLTSKKVNQQQAIDTKIQALLNWHQFAVGAVDGKWGKNTVKAMQAFQQSRNLPITEKMNEQTWTALTDNQALNTQPVLVNYTLTDADINTPIVKIPATAEAKAKLDTMGYERLTEALAEKFHIDEQYLKRLNPNAKYAMGEVITVYNPGQPNLTAITHLIADKGKQQLFGYNAQEQLIAVYPTTVGSSETPSPTGTHQVKNRVLKPNYTHTNKSSKQKDILQPGPNNPVGLVWLGLDKESYGIHGSPDPEAISRQASQGCIRLTNWDALGLYGTIQDGAKVEFK